jgi:hypothetical protein
MRIPVGLKLAAGCGMQAPALPHLVMKPLTCAALLVPNAGQWGARARMKRGLFKASGLLDATALASPPNAGEREPADRMSGVPYPLDDLRRARREGEQ